MASMRSGWRHPAVVGASIAAMGVCGCAPGSSAQGAPELAPLSGSGSTIRVNTAMQLTSALRSVEPGQTIELADGTYRGNFVLRRSGTRADPIRIVGSRRAVLNGGTVTEGYVLHLDRARHVRVVGFSVANGQKAVVLDGARRVVLRRLNLHTTGSEVLLLRNYSRHNVVRGSLIHDSGRVNPQWGEGVYVGLSSTNWSDANQSRTGGDPDTSDRNQIIGNRIFDTTAECIDVKEGTTGGRIVGNRMDGSSLTGDNYADSWVDIAGNRYKVTGNIGTNSGTVLRDGFQTRPILTGWGRHIVFRRNESRVNGPGYAIRILGPRNVVYASNTQTGAEQGLTNVPVTR